MAGNGEACEPIEDRTRHLMNSRSIKMAEFGEQEALFANYKQRGGPSAALRSRTMCGFDDLPFERDAV